MFKQRAKKFIKALIRFGDWLATTGSVPRVSSTLVLIRLDAIGDFILWLDTAKEYRRLYPAHKITLIANSVWADLAMQLPYWDEVLPIDIRDLSVRRPFKRWRLLRAIGNAGFHTAIQPIFSRVLMEGDSVARATNAVQRIGSVGDLSNITAMERELSDRWYTKLLPANPAPMMELQRNAEFFSALSGAAFCQNIPKLPDRKELPLPIDVQQAYFILFPGASWQGRCWPIAHFAELLVTLQERYGWHAVLCGSQAEFELCESVAALSQKPCKNLAGQTTLSQLAELIRYAHLLVGNETSAVHIAAAVQTPAVCILGGGHYGRFLPYPQELDGIKPLVALQPMACFHCNWRCNQPHDPMGPVPCISSVSVAQVLDCVGRALGSQTQSK